MPADASHPARGPRPPRVTMEDVAGHAGVSRALVSIVLRGVPGASPENRQRVLRAAEELDYHPDQRARLLGSSRSRTVGVVHGLHEAFHGALVEALYRAAAGSGWRLALGPTAPSRPEATAVRELLDHRCEAVVLLGPALPVRDLAALAAKVPVVVVARRVRGADVDVVRTDDAAGARAAVEHLVALGHRRVAHLHGGRAPGAAERRAGYLAASRAAGLVPQLVAAGPHDDDGERVAVEVLRPGGPTAVLAFNDACAAGFLAAARTGGLDVPGDVSVVGFDDSPVARLRTVDLTTVAQDVDTLAARALTRAAARAADATAPPGADVVPPRLLQRSTTSALGPTG